jgi:hypothetical protein
MATVDVGRFIVSTEEKYEREAWHAEFLVSAEDADFDMAIFRELDGGAAFDSSESAAIAALERGVEFAQSLENPRVIGLLTLYS